jgi:hypothetical protein
MNEDFYGASTKDNVVPVEQADALEDHHASSGQTVLFDGEDGFVEAGSIKVALKIMLSLYERS